VLKENCVINKTDLTGDVLTVREASLLLRVHPDKLTALARRGIIPAGVVGSRWRFSRLALLAHLATPQKGPIKPTRKLVDYPPAKLIARVQKLGGNLVVKDGGLRIEGLSRLSPKLKKAIQANVHQIIKELQ
jgi:excisionase family DNA binding protein